MSPLLPPPPGNFNHTLQRHVLYGLIGYNEIGSKKCNSYSCSKFRKSPYVYIAAAMLIGKRVPTMQPICPYNIIENPPTFLAHNSVFIGPNKFKFGSRV